MKMLDIISTMLLIVMGAGCATRNIYEKPVFTFAPFSSELLGRRVRAIQDMFVRRDHARE